jgi:hypothetical protein
MNRDRCRPRSMPASRRAGLVAAVLTSALVLTSAIAVLLPSAALAAASGSNLVNVSGLCLDANSNRYAGDGDNLQLWSCNSHPEQEWILTGANQLVNTGAPGMCLDANSNRYPRIGDNVQLWACNTHPEQLWTLNGSGQLQNLGASGMCLDANSNDYAKVGDPLQLWACNTHPEQLWEPLAPLDASIVANAAGVPNGTDGGQCLVWVADMVRAAGGPSIAFGENESTYQSQWAQIATPVSWSDVRPGDIVQFYAGGNAHTAIVMSGNSPSTARVVDSNYAYNGLVSRGTFLSRAAPFDDANYTIWRVR